MTTTSTAARAQAPATFTELILRLQNFWSAQGCAILQGYDHEVGAGTMNPQTYLRVLGPEPWNVAYVEPSHPARGPSSGSRSSACSHKPRLPRGSGRLLG